MIFNEFMKQTSKMFSRYFQNKNSIKGDKRKDIQRFLQTMLMNMVDTPYLSKESRIKSYSLVTVKHSAVKLSSNLFGVSNQTIKSKTIK